MMSPKILGSRPDVWNEPNVFNPERWENDSSHPYQLIPFLVILNTYSLYYHYLN